MIEKITNTHHLSNVYFEDIDRKIGLKDECYLIRHFYLYYYSTKEAAINKAKSLKISQEIKIKDNKKKTDNSLLSYIENEYDGIKVDFAKAQGVQPAQVTQWLKKDFIVIDNKLYSKRRDLK